MRGLNVDSNRFQQSHSNRAWIPQACIPKEGVERCLYRIEGDSRAFSSLTHKKSRAFLLCMQRSMPISQMVPELENYFEVIMLKMVVPTYHMGRFLKWSQKNWGPFVGLFQADIFGPLLYSLGLKSLSWPYPPCLSLIP